MFLVRIGLIADQEKRVGCRLVRGDLDDLGGAVGQSGDAWAGGCGGEVVWAGVPQPVVCQVPLALRRLCSRVPLVVTATSWVEPFGMAVMAAWAIPVDPAGVPQPVFCQEPLALRMSCLRMPPVVTSMIWVEPLGMPARLASVIFTPGWVRVRQPCQVPLA